ncbi:MAG: curli-like amyloid fiber formation chaperone CsgH [Hyphomonadaceae bacterium]|nr:curli-like amyloid fiber formation chaperone CsgH [Hyphomonadaceae bacterium]
MMRLVTVAVLALAACAAQARNETLESVPPSEASVVVAEATRVAQTASVSAAVTCDIRATRTANGVRLEAIAHADRPVRGAYAFDITARGAGGSSDVTQGGSFAVEAGGNGAIVGSVEIPSGSYRVVLTLSDAAGELCRFERRS